MSNEPNAICQFCKKEFVTEPGWDDFCSLACEIAYDNKLFSNEMQWLEQQGKKYDIL